VFRPFAEELALCKRYYQKSFPYAVTPVQNGGQAGVLQYVCKRTGLLPDRFVWQLPVQLRTDIGNGTETYYSPSAATSDWWNATATAQASGTSAAQGLSDDSRILIFNSQIANDAIGDLIMIHATMDVEL
jgi:hypothetical protein